MVASSPRKPLFEGNYPSNLEPLFFEFDLELIPVSFEPLANISTFTTNSNRRKVANIASKLVLGLLITALIMGSGVLNNELMVGKSITQANLSWIPSWPEEVPASVVATTAEIAVSESTDVSEKPAPFFVASESNNDFFPTVLPISMAGETKVEETKIEVEAIPSTVNSDKEIKNTVALNEKTAPAFKPIIEEPVIDSEIKRSESSTKSIVAHPNKLEIISDDFHTISAASAMDGKKVFIKFGAKWCLPCKMMEANVFPDPQISQLLLRDYHTLTVDVDNIDGINLRQFFQVEAIPSFIILDNQQNIMGKYEGAKRIEELRSILGRMTP